jgi:hypothetical protein
MSKLGKRSLMDNDQLLEGGGAGAGGRSGGKYTFDRITGSRGAKDHKENARDSRTEELSGRMSFEPSYGRDYGGRTGRTSDDYKKGGKVSASSRADGCCVKGKTKGRMV